MNVNNAVVVIQKRFRAKQVRQFNQKEKDAFNFDIIDQQLNEYIRSVNNIKNLNSLLGNTSKSVRNENFPYYVSENIAKLAILKYFGVLPTWNTTKGDLQIISYDDHKHRIQIEVKAFMSMGPNSFGPTEEFDKLCFVDCLDFVHKTFKIYFIPYGNTSQTIRNVVLSGTQFDDTNLSPLPENLDALSTKDLKLLCEKRALNIGGKREVLIERLQTEKPGSKFKKPKTFGEICDNNSRGELRGAFYTCFKPKLQEHCILIFDGHLNDLKP